MRRISIVGPTGSGKSYLARQLSGQLAIPAHELDRMREGSAGRPPSQVELVDAVTEVANGRGWIIDGHYRDLRHLIWNRADTVIWLNYGLSVVAFRLLKRFAGKEARRLNARVATEDTSYDQAAAEAEHDRSASWSMRLSRIRKTLRERAEYAAILRSAKYQNIDLIELKSPRQTRIWLESAGGTEEPSRLIELFGLPGAGKTTLVNSAGASLDYETRHDLLKKRKSLPFAFKIKLLFRATSDLPFIKEACLFLLRNRVSNPEGIGRILKIILMKPWWNSCSGLMLLDQADLQGIWSALFAAKRYQPSPAAIAPLLRVIYERRNAKIIFIGVDSVVAVRRIMQRSYGNSRFDRLAEADALAQVNHARTLVMAILDAARMADLDVHELDGSKSPAELAEQLSRIVNGSPTGFASDSNPVNTTVRD